MKLVLLGSGNTVLTIAETLLADARFTIPAMGVYNLESAAGCALSELARKNRIPLIDRLDEIGQFRPDYVYMLSYPTLIPESLLCTFDFINTHFALLPRFRGWHGLVWSIINGESEVGYTVHRAAAGIDDGPIYFQHRTPLLDTDTINTVLERLNLHLIENIADILTSIANGLPAIPQDESNAIYVTRRYKRDGLIHWSAPSTHIHNLVRALTPPAAPGAFTFYKDQELIIRSSEVLHTPSYIGQPGKIVNIQNGRGIWVKTGDSALLVKEVTYRGRDLPATDLFGKVGLQLG